MLNRVSGAATSCVNLVSLGEVDRSILAFLGVDGETKLEKVYVLGTPRLLRVPLRNDTAVLPWSLHTTCGEHIDLLQQVDQLPIDALWTVCIYCPCPGCRCCSGVGARTT
jgi:hypothetical protein